MATVEIDEVTKVYPNGVEAVQSLTLQVMDGELMVLVGPSGCGKTTVLRMVAGLEEISSGEVLIGGRVVNDVSPKARDIAMVFQNYALYPHMTVAANIGLGLKLRVQMRAEVSNIQRRLGVTTLYVTHDQTEAMTMGDRVAVLMEGVLQQCAPPQLLYDRPDNVFVAAFIGSPAMNMYEGLMDPDGISVSLGSQRLLISDDVFRARPALAKYRGKKVWGG